MQWRSQEFAFSPYFPFRSLPSPFPFPTLPFPLPLPALRRGLLKYLKHGAWGVL